MKKFLLIFFGINVFMGWLNSAFCQPPQKDWDRRYGGVEGLFHRPGADLSYSIIKDGDNYLGCGVTYSTLGGDISEITRDTSRWNTGDYWIIKVDLAGNLIWNKRFGGYVTDNPYVIKKIGLYYYVAGSSNSRIECDKTDPLKGSGAYDIWVIKIDENGNKIWDKSYGGSDTDQCFQIVALSENSIMLMGVSYSDVGYDKTENSRGRSDIWLVKIDTAGNKIWDKTIGGSDFENCAYKLIIKPNDDTLVIGASAGSSISGEKTENSRGDWDYWVLKIDTNGVIKWDKTFGGDQTDFLISLKQTSDGGYILCGHSTSGISGDKTTSNYGNWDYWVVKIDGQGNKLWDKTYGGSGDDQLLDVEIDLDGNIVLGGFSNTGAEGTKTEASRGDYDMWIIKIDNNGDIIWDKSFGGSKAERLYDIIVLDVDTYILSGWSMSPADGDKSQDTWGSFDFWLLKTKPGDPFALEDLKLQTATYRDKIKLTWKDSRPQGSEVRYAILHSSGKEIKSSNWDTLGYTGQKEYNHLHPEYGTHRYRICRMEEFGGCSVSNIQSVTYENHLERIIITTNRAQEAINIEYQLPDERGSVSVYNGQGSLIHEQRLSHKGLLHIETINWPSGVYYFQFVGIYGVLESRKVIVEK